MEPSFQKHWHFVKLLALKIVPMAELGLNSSLADTTFFLKGDFAWLHDSSKYLESPY